MNSYRLKQVTIALAALLLLLGLGEIFRGGFDEPQGDFELPTVAREVVDSIVIRRVADTITLVRRDSADWTVNGHDAAETSINEFFEAISEQSRGQLIAQSAATHRRLEIDDNLARTLLVFGGGETMVHILAGKRGSTFQDAYFRRPDENDVYSVRTRLTTYIERRLDDWRDRTVAAISPDSVGSAEFRRGRRRSSMRREGDGWVLPNGRSADSAAVATVLRQYQTLNATGFPSPAQLDSADFSSSERSATLRDLQGEVLVDIVFDSTAGAFWVRRDGDSTIFRISTFTIDRLTPTDSTLRAR